ncbi:MAG TPA: HD domain-containing protein [Bdellovibrionales bacterium]|nr:HD domain-containing protein [Bdellovibrionales bacterium]
MEIKMEIKDPVHGSLELTPPEVAVLDSPAFQRLRSIKQLGFGEFSYPGATHNRYLHSLGASHIAGEAFDSVFRGFAFKNPAARWRMRQALRLAALLHDIGHGPLSHTTEEVMPHVKNLNVKAYQKTEDRRATHEDYTIKFITDSPLTALLKDKFPDMDPMHIAALIDKNLEVHDDFFVDDDRNFRTVLCQLVSSELDVDRMDYLLRDSYFCGTNYGKFELGWMLANLTTHELEGRVHLALNRRALYTFDDFLISRHHMYLMVYFHHKSIVYDEMLGLYLTSKDCTFSLPADINEYLKYNDYKLYQHLSGVDNQWARRISERRPLRVLFELHSTSESGRPEKMKEALEAEGVNVILASSEARLSKYHTSLEGDKNRQIYVVDQYDRGSKPYPLDKSTEIFQKYERARRIDRLYVAPEDYSKAEGILLKHKL